MLCEISSLFGDSFLAVWVAINLLMFVSVMVSSSTVFYFFYWPSNVTFDKWRYKSNPQFPSPEKVRDEIVQTLKGMLCASICPALSVYLAATNQFGGISKAFCGWGEFGWQEHAMTLTLAWVGSDLYEFLYHRLGHVNFTFWTQHKHHHVFYNPSPFSVIADEWIDQFLRSVPLLIIPLLMPINIDLLFVMYGIFFYFYGVYLHSGYELPFLSAHNSIINTSFQHYCHHAKSLMNKPYHCGFFIKLWDQLFKCTYPDDRCFCAECSRGKGERTQDAFKQVKVPNYASLFTTGLWLDLFRPTIKAAAAS